MVGGYGIMAVGRGVKIKKSTLVILISRKIEVIGEAF
jgi:hypothetical protein